MELKSTDDRGSVTTMLPDTAGCTIEATSTTSDTMRTICELAGSNPALIVDVEVVPNELDNGINQCSFRFLCGQSGMSGSCPQYELAAFFVFHLQRHVFVMSRFMLSPCASIRELTF